jgi:hypothetical protein
MTNKSEITMNNRSIVGDIISWFFGIIFLAIGLINTFWGNDPGYGVFIALLAFLFFPPVHVLIKNITGFSIPLLAKITLGIFIIWSAIGVGELFDKMVLMMKDL